MCSKTIGIEIGIESFSVELVFDCDTDFDPDCFFNQEHPQRKDLEASIQRSISSKASGLDGTTTAW
jgi:hypothetical protein